MTSVRCGVAMPIGTGSLADLLSIRYAYVVVGRSDVRFQGHGCVGLISKSCHFAQTVTKPGLVPKLRGANNFVEKLASASALIKAIGTIGVVPSVYSTFNGYRVLSWSIYAWRASCFGRCSAAADGSRMAQWRIAMALGA